MAIKVVLFDFDGTIADTLDAAIRIGNQLAEEFGYRTASPEDIRYLKTLNSHQILKYVGVPLIKVPFLIRRLKKSLSQEVEQLQPISGIAEVLHTLKHQGIQLGIITSNSRQNVTLFLKAHQLLDLFDFLQTGVTIFGKNQVIQHFLRREHLGHDSVIYVGDETRDIESAKKGAIRVVAVTWGFNSEEALQAMQPDFLIQQPLELLEVVQQLSESQRSDGL